MCLSAVNKTSAVKKQFLEEKYFFKIYSKKFGLGKNKKSNFC